MPRIADELQPLFFAILGNEPTVRIQFWDGSALGDADCKATAVFKSPEALRHIVWAPGELGLARAYVTGHIDFEGDVYYALSQLLGAEPKVGSLSLKTIISSLASVKRMGLLSARPTIPSEETVPPGRIHSKWRDAAAISHHYDVGNAFYRLVLGESMTYSCARFVTGDEDLDTAQFQKYDMICRKLGLREGMRLLDVGCGWGGMVLHAARHYGVRPVGITLSAEQAKRAKQRVEEAHLSDRIAIRIQDYRDLRDESFDAISSIGMFEHVGHGQMRQYFSTLYAALAPEGRILNHAISKPSGSAMASKGFIAKYVFPDGELQDVSVSTSALQKAGFELRDVESLREHYDRTLRFWVNNLEENWDEAVRLVGEVRARVWRIYMMGSAVSFDTNRISIHQTLGVKTPDTGISSMPLTRQTFV